MTVGDETFLSNSLSRRILHNGDSFVLSNHSSIKRAKAQTHLRGCIQKLRHITARCSSIVYLLLYHSYCYQAIFFFFFFFKCNVQSIVMDFNVKPVASFSNSFFRLFEEAGYKLIYFSKAPRIRVVMIDRQPGKSVFPRVGEPKKSRAPPVYCIATWRGPKSAR